MLGPELLPTPDAPSQNLRSSNSHTTLQPYADLPSSSYVQWEEWTHQVVSPDLSRSHDDVHDGLHGYEEGNAFTSAYRTSDAERIFAGLEDGMDVEEYGRERGIMAEEVEPLLPTSEGSDSTRVRTRFQSRVTRGQTSPAQPYPVVNSSPSSPSPGRSRSTSFRAQLSTPLTLDISRAPSPGFFPGGLPSPFRQPSTPNSATMDPAHSVRSSSPSETSSLAGYPMSRLGSSSAASSVYGGEGGTGGRGSAYQPSAHRSTNQHALQRRASASPKKGLRKTTKLTNQDRKNICLHREAHPSIKQDLIGEIFGVERSTVSKILKNKDRWLAITTEEDDYFSTPSSPRTSAAPLSSSRPPISSSSTTSSAPASFVPSPATTVRIIGGRYPRLDEELVNWARTRVLSGTPLTDEALHSHALSVAPHIEGCENFKGSPVWLEKFKQRAGISEGTFVDLLSPETKARSLTASGHRGDREEESSDAEGPADDDDGDFEDKPTRSVKKSLRQSLSRSRVERRATMSGPLERAVTPSTSQMEIDDRTPSHSSGGRSGAQATPMHSSQQFQDSFGSQRTQGGRRQEVDPRAMLPTVRTPPTRNNSQSSQSSMAVTSYLPPDSPAGLYPYSIDSEHHGYSQTYPGQELAYPLQSPFQPGHSPYAHQSLQPRPIPSQESPNLRYHARSNSIASTASSYSGLTAFSSQGGSGTPLSGSFTGSFTASSGSLPSTPSTGYFGHGPDGTQSQLQAAFLIQQHSAPIPPSSHAVPIRRASMSNALPYQASTQRPQVSFDQAYNSLKTALEYLSAEGHGYVSPADIIVLSDLKGKMANAMGAPLSQTGRVPIKGRLRVERSGSGTALGRQRTGSASSLLGAIDYPTTPVVMEEGH